MEMAIIPEHAVQEALDVLVKSIELGDARHPPSTESNDPFGLLCDDAEQLETQADVFEMALDAFRYAVNHRIANLRRRRNQIAPIHRLPTELLVLIMEQVKPAAVYDYYPRLLSLAEVSSRWYTTVLSTPRLWTKVISSCDIEFVKIILRRSKQAPLDIEYLSTYAGDEHQFLKTVLPSVGRWRSFRNLGNSYPAWPDSTPATLCMPSLEHVHLSTSGRMREFPNRFLDHSPRLSHLEISGFSLPLNSPVLSRLKSIRFTAAVAEAHLSLRQWETFLSSSPELENIVAEGHSGAVSGFTESSVFEVSMPKLETISFLNLPPGLVGTLLRSIIPAHSCYPSVNIGSPNNDGNGLCALFPTSASTSSLLGRIREMTNLHASCFDDCSGLALDARNRIGTKLLTLSNGIGFNRPSELFESLVPSVGLPSLVYITLKGSPFFDGKSLFLSLPRCDGLQSFIAMGVDKGSKGKSSSKALDRLCSSLLTSPNMSSEGGPCPCPKLQTLKICGSHAYTLTPILKMVKARYGGQEDNTAPSSVALPVNLTSSLSACRQFVIDITQNFTFYLTTWKIYGPIRLKMNPAELKRNLRMREKLVDLPFLKVLHGLWVLARFVHCIIPGSFSSSLEPVCNLIRNDTELSYITTMYGQIVYNLDSF